jgi:DNA-binding NarL/FixJ family response regulator
LNLERKLRVVIADDTRLILRVCSCLVNECHRAELVGTARNGAELLNVCRSAQPDLVLVDVHMPVMNGLEAVALITEEFPDMSVVFVTSDDSDQLKNECMALGSLAVLPKLTSQAELCTLMGELIGSCDLRSHK